MKRREEVVMIEVDKSLDQTPDLPSHEITLGQISNQSDSGIDIIGVQALRSLSRKDLADLIASFINEGLGSDYLSEDCLSIAENIQTDLKKFN